MTSDSAFPPLSLALAAAAASQLHAEEQASPFRDGFRGVVPELEQADADYRRAIGEVLPEETATRVLAALQAFRRRVAEVRLRVRHEIGDIYRRYGRDYGDFDPLDLHAPPATGLTHADGTRVATISDGARSTVDSLRAQVNEDVVKLLAPAQIDLLLLAKRRRRDAFEATLKRALEAVLPADSIASRDRVARAAYQLMELADGWY